MERADSLFSFLWGAQGGRVNRRSCWRRCGRRPGGGRASGGCRTSWQMRCNRTALDFLDSTDVRRRIPAEEDAVSEFGRRAAGVGGGAGCGACGA